MLQQPNTVPPRPSGQPWGTRLRRAGLWAVLCLPVWPMSVQAAQPVSALPVVHWPGLLGDWYEVARLDNPLERACAHSPRARYQWSSSTDALLELVNQCTLANGRIKRVVGYAPVHGHGGQLAVSPSRWLGRVLSMPYWILQVEPAQGQGPYQHVLIGSPDRRLLWLMSRQPVLPAGVEARLLQRAAQMGYRVDQLRRDPHLP